MYTKTLKTKELANQTSIQRLFVDILFLSTNSGLPSRQPPASDAAAALHRDGPRGVPGGAGAGRAVRGREPRASVAAAAGQRAERGAVRRSK